MPGIARVDVDYAGGLLVGPLVPSVRVNGAPVVVRGTLVAPHGRDAHENAVMVGASVSVRAGGIPVCRSGDAASCGHVDTGSGDVSAGG